MLRTLHDDDERYVQTYWSRFGKHTYLVGDAASRDADGYIRILGRIDDVINVSGHRLRPPRSRPRSPPTNTSPRPPWSPGGPDDARDAARAARGTAHRGAMIGARSSSEALDRARLDNTVREDRG